MADRSITALVAGLLYVVLGTLFLLDRLGVVDLSVTFVWPVLLIGLGIAVLLGARRRPEPQAPEPPRVPERPAPEAESPAPATEASEPERQGPAPGADGGSRPPEREGPAGESKTDREGSAENRDRTDGPEDRDRTD